MPRYIALLRGINVSGQKIIKMDDLRKIFESFSLKNVATYIQSGNVLFDSTSKSKDAIIKKIEKGLLETLGYDISVILRTPEEMREIVKIDPFKKIGPDDDVGTYIVFMNEPLSPEPKAPLLSPKKDVKVLQFYKNHAFCLSLPDGKGRYGFPNAFIEKEFKVVATTRNWNTTCKLAE